MAKTIMDFPNETITNVFSFLEDISDLRTVSETSKRFNANVEKHLYHTVGFSNRQGHGWSSPRGLPKLIWTLIQRPELALLIKRATFIDYDPVRGRRSLKQRDLTFTARNFKGPDGICDEMVEDIKQELRKGSDSVYWAALMIMCTKLEILDMDLWDAAYDEDDWGYTQWVPIILQAALSPNSVLFPRLRRINSYRLLLLNERRHGDKEGFVIPSIRELCVFNELDGGEVPEISKRCPHLRSLELHKVLCDTDGCVQKVVAGLMTLAPTLESLSLVGTSEYNLAHLDFRPFNRLKDLALNLQGLEHTNWPASEQMRIVDQLPHNLEQLELRYIETLGILNGLPRMYGLERRTQTTPQNRKRAFEDYCTLLETLKQCMLRRQYTSMKLLHLAFAPDPIHASTFYKEETIALYSLTESNDPFYLDFCIWKHPVRCLGIMVKKTKADELRDAIKTEGVRFQFDKLDSKGSSVEAKLIDMKWKVVRETKEEKRRRLDIEGYLLNR